MYRLTNSNPKQDGYTGPYAEFYTAYETSRALDAKQDKLTAGTGILLSPANEISTDLQALLDDTTASTSTTYSSSKIDDLIQNVVVTPYTVKYPLVLNDHEIQWPDVAPSSGHYGSTTKIPVLEVTDYGLISSIGEVGPFYAPSTSGLEGQYWKSKGYDEGEWQEPDSVVTASSQALVTSAAVYTALESVKALIPIYTAGDNVTISGNIISSNQIDDSVTTNTKTWSSTRLSSLLSSKQDTLVAGEGVQMVGNVISVKDYTDLAMKSYVHDYVSRPGNLPYWTDADSNIVLDLASGKLSLRNVPEIDDTTPSASKVFSSSKTSDLLSSLNAVVQSKQDALSVSLPLKLDSSMLSMEQVSAAGEYGDQNYADATLVPHFRVDLHGRVTDAGVYQIYPPLDSGLAGQYWRSDGSGRGRWRSPAGILTRSDTEIPSSAAVMDYIDSGERVMLTFRGTAANADDLPLDPPPTVGSFWIAVDDFTVEFERGVEESATAGDWVVFNYSDTDPDAYKWYVWPLSSGSVVSVNGKSGAVVLTGDDIEVSEENEDDRKVSEVIAEVEEHIGDMDTLETEATASLVLAVNELEAAKQNKIEAEEPLVLEDDEDDPKLGTSKLSATFDDEPTEDSKNFLSSDVIYKETYADVKAVDVLDNEIHDTKLKHLTKAQYDALRDAGELDAKTYYAILDDAGQQLNMMSLFQGLYSASPADWDIVPTERSVKPVTSGGIYKALQDVRNASVQILEALPAEGDSGTIYYVYDETAQGYATFVWDAETESFRQVGSATLSLNMDSSPTASSTNAATSGGIWSAIRNAVKAYTKDGVVKDNQKVVFLTSAEYEALDVKDENTYYFVEDLPE